MSRPSRRSSLRRGLLRLALVLAFLVQLPAGAQTRRALVIGLGEQLDRSWAKINGDRDIPLVVGMLREAGYADIATLRNEQATKAAIVSAFRSLAQRSRRGDIVYIHFSGHGQQMTDVDRDELSDRYDEAWIPYDAYLRYCPQDRGERHLCDDEIHTLLTAIRRSVGSHGRILVVADACHSGDSSRGAADGEVVRGVMQRFEIPAAPTQKATSHKSEHWLMLSACKSYQVNTELRNPVAGKLTYALVTAARHQHLLSNDALIGYITAFMDKYSGRLPQTPLVQGKDKFNIVDLLRR